MAECKLKVAFLIARTNLSTTQAIDLVCRLDGVEVVGVLLDPVVSSPKNRWHNLKRNIRREGLSYLFYRAITASKERLELWADQVIPQVEVEGLLDRVFPTRNLASLAQRYGFRIIRSGNLNQPAAIETLRSLGADLGVVLGTRILKRPLFSIPRLGCINLHKGQVPDYRGTPPGFWELYDGKDVAGVTVHFVDDGLDTGDVVGAVEIPIHPKETPESLKTKLDEEGNRLLVTVVEQLAGGEVQRRPQSPSNLKPRTRPTRVQTAELAARLPHWRRLDDGRHAFKIAAWLFIFHTGVYALVRRLRRGGSRGAILLYHRINDISADVLTASTRRFAEHLITLNRYYHLMATEEIVERVASRTRIQPTSVAIHFDDCYLDVRTNAAPLLAAAGIPGVAFISSGFVDTARVFRHDETKYPHRFANLRTHDVKELSTFGVAVAAHTVNHADLGMVDFDQAKVEVEESRRQLEQLIGCPVLLFSFPFGKIANIREEVRQIVVRSGYRALFSAGGGFVGPKTELFDIPRFGVSSDHSPLALMMELEGISLENFKRWLTAKRA